MPDLSKGTITTDIPTKDEGKNKKRNTVIIVAVTVVAVLIIGFIVFFIFRGDGLVEAQKEVIKETYSEVGVELSNNDFTVSQRTVEVVEDKRTEAQKKSSKALETLNTYVTPKEFNNNHPVSPDEPIKPTDISAKLNDELGYVKSYLDRSLSDDNHYAKPLKELLDNVRNGARSKVYDNHEDLTCDAVFGVVCIKAYSSMINRTDKFVWNNSDLRDDKSTVLSNVILKELYNSQLSSVDVFVEDNTKTYTIDGKETTSTFMALCGAKRVYLDASCNILDIE